MLSNPRASPNDWAWAHRRGTEHSTRQGRQSWLDRMPECMYVKRIPLSAGPLPLSGQIPGVGLSSQSAPSSAVTRAEY